MNTIIAAFCDQAAANDAIAMLRNRGVTDIELLDGTPKGSEIMRKLRDFNVPEDRAQLYAEVNRRGAPIICAHTEGDATEIAEELDQRGSLDLEAAADRWRKEGWNGYDMNALPFDAAACAAERAQLTRESGLATEAGLEEQPLAGKEQAAVETEGRDLEVVEERVVVGKREVPREALRVRTFIAERPVRQQVQLTEEHINVQREPANEPVSPGAVESALTEDEFVVTARGEEAVVGKEARVVERVHVGKTAETHTETIEETERRRDVEVESIKEEETTPTRPRR